MSTRKAVPDAWDDDWTFKAATLDGPSEGVHPSSKVSKAERRAKQAEFNKKIWEQAETENNPYVLHTRNDVPLKSEFKPSVQVLSRKPAPKVLPRKDCTSGIEQLSIDDDEDEDEDESKKTALTLEERQQKAQREREEKQKKYEEVRERLFGSDKVSDTSSPGIITLPNNKSGGDTRYRGRSKGARDSRPSSSNGNKTRQLFEPNHNPKPDSIFVQKKETQSTSGRSTPAEVQIIRHPRGPDGSGRGGIGFARRGDKRGIT